MRLNLFFKAAILSIAAFALSYGFFKMAGNNFHYKTCHKWTCIQEKIYFQTFDKDIPLTNIHSIIIFTEKADIRFHPTNNPAGKVSVTTNVDNKDALKVATKGQSLIITTNELKNHYFSSLNLDLPPQVKTVTINTKEGDITMDHSELNKLIINSINGNVDLDQVNTDESNIMTVDGNIDWKGMIKKTDLKTVSGDINIVSSFNSPNYDLKSVTGTINLSIVKNIKAKFDIQSVTGEVNINPTTLLSAQNNNNLIRIRNVNGDINIEER